MSTELTTLLQECDALKLRLSSLRPMPVEALKKIQEASHTEKHPEAFQTLVAEAEKMSMHRYLSILGETV